MLTHPGMAQLCTVFKASSYPLAHLSLTTLVGRVITPILQMMLQEVKSDQSEVMIVDQNCSFLVGTE